MKLIKKLPTRFCKTGKKQSWAVFWCNGCKSEVERQLGNGKIAKSCGCMKNELISESLLGQKRNFKHGEVRTKLFNVWSNMKDRCFNSNNKRFKDWGGRGIAICDEWLEFIPFRDWSLSNGYQEDLEIDCVDNNGNYSPENCRFVVSRINCQNRRTTKLNKEKANEIRALYKTGKYTTRRLAKMFNLNSKSTVIFILNNQIWKK